MYKIIKEGVLVGSVESILFVKRNKQNIWVEALPKEAEAVSFNGFLYSVKEIDICEEDAGEQANRTNIDLANLELKYRLVLQQIVNILINNKVNFNEKDLKTLKSFLVKEQEDYIKENLTK